MEIGSLKYKSIVELQNVPDELRHVIERVDCASAQSHIQALYTRALFEKNIETRYILFYRCSIWCDIISSKSDFEAFGQREGTLYIIKYATFELTKLRRQLEEKYGQLRVTPGSSTSRNEMLQPMQDVSQMANQISRNLVGNDTSSGHLNDLLECSICYQQFDRPLQLSCGHTFCSTCVDRLTEQARTRNPNNFEMFVRRQPPTTNNRCTFYTGAVRPVTIDCPECRKPTLVPAGGLTVNYRLNEMIERVTKAASVVEPVKPIDNMCHCESCDGPLSGGIYFMCNSCPETADFLCAMCAIRKHNGHDIVEKQVVSELEIEATREDVNLQSSRAWRAIDMVEASINQISLDGETTVLKILREAVDHYGVLAEGLTTVSNDTAVVLEERKALAKSIADRFDRTAKNIEIMSKECKKGFAGTAKELADFLRESGIEVKTEPPETMDIVGDTNANAASNSSTVPVDGQPTFTLAGMMHLL